MMFTTFKWFRKKYLSTYTCVCVRMHVEREKRNDIANGAKCELVNLGKELSVIYLKLSCKLEISSK